MKFEVGQKVRIKSKEEIIAMYGSVNEMPYGIDPFGTMVTMLGTLQTITRIDRLDPSYGYLNNNRVDINGFNWSEAVLEIPKVVVNQLEV